MTCGPRSESKRATGIGAHQLPCRWTLKWWAEPAYREPWLAKTPGGRRPTPRGPNAAGSRRQHRARTFNGGERAWALEAGRALYPRKNQGKALRALLRGAARAGRPKKGAPPGVPCAVAP